MRYRAPGQHKDLESFRAHLRALDPAFDCAPRPGGAGGPLGQGIEAGRLRIANRWAVHPMEGWDGTREGGPGERTLRRWRRFGQSGAKLVWGGEAVAVRTDGRANPRQLSFSRRRDLRADLERLRAEILAGHREVGEDPSTLCIGLQLTHSGRFARPDGPPAPRVAVRVPLLDARVGLAPHGDGPGGGAPVLTDGELEAIGEDFVAAALAARDAGFDFVDVKACHGYLLHELLGARARPGPYGGELAGRARLLLRILAAIRAAAPQLELAVRASLGDLFPHRADPATGVGAPLDHDPAHPYGHGFGLCEDDPRASSLEEPLALLALLRAAGVRLVSATLGSPYWCPHVQRPAARPPSDGYLPPEDPLASVLRHLRAVRACKAAFPDLVLVGSGYSYLQEWLPHVAEHEVGAGHVDLVGIGRMVLSYPELPLDCLHGRALDRRRLCRTFSDCTTAPRNGLASGCYPLDEYYKRSPEAARLAELKRGAR